jgi:hypothetical protein
VAFGVPLDEVTVVRAEPEEDGVDALADLDELVLVLRAVSVRSTWILFASQRRELSMPSMPELVTRPRFS